MAGLVSIKGYRADKPGAEFPEDVVPDIKELPRYVSRGGYKLEKALEYFRMDIKGKLCLDCGASTGGFTDCLLKHGAAAVIAVDVGYGQFEWKLRNDPRITLLEKTNIRNVCADMLPFRPQLAVADLSFISINLVFEAIRSVSEPEAEFVFLIKPQFEAGKGEVEKKGVLKEPEKHIAILIHLMDTFRKAGYKTGLTWSPLKGPKGNIEYLAYLKKTANLSDKNQEDQAVKVVREAFETLN